MREMLRRVRRRILPGWIDEWPRLARKARSCRSLQLGCGRGTPLPGIVNVDGNASTKPHVVCDLDAAFPFRDDSFEMVVAISTLEHLKDFFAAMGEIHRVARPGASVHILVPHFSSAAAFVDPSHRQRLSARACDYFVRGTPLERDYGFYVPYRYRLERRHVELAGFWNWVPPARWLSERCTALWEDHLCYAIRGRGVYWELEVVKEPSR